MTQKTKLLHIIKTGYKYKVGLECFGFWASEGQGDTWEEAFADADRRLK